MTKLAVALHALVIVLIVPYLEVSATHLFNPDWPAHARLHEAWQLVTNAALAILAVLYVWAWRRPMTALAICLAVSAPFLLAWITKGTYGGSMQHSDGSEILVLGVNAAVLLMFVITTLLTVALAREAGNRSKEKALP